MTTQERINSLALAALEQEPAAAPFSTQLAATAAPSSTMEVESLFSGFPAVEGEYALNAPAPQPVPAAPVVAPAKMMELASEMREIIEVREAKMKKKQSRARLLVTSLFLFAFIGTGAAIAISPSARQSCSNFVMALQECKGDFKSIGNIMGSYNQQLSKIAVQGARVDAATRALGVDPDKEAEGDLDLNAEMKKMSGGPNSGPTTLERDEKLKSTFGVISKLAGSDPNKIKSEAKSDIKF